MVKCYPETLGGATLDRPAVEGSVTQTIETGGEAGAGLDLRTDAQKDLAPEVVSATRSVAVTTSGPLPRERMRKGERTTDAYHRAEMTTGDSHQKEGRKNEPGPHRDGAERDATLRRGTLRRDTLRQDILRDTPRWDIVLPGIRRRDTRPLEATAGGIGTTGRSSGLCLRAAKKPAPPPIKEPPKKPPRKNQPNSSRPPRRCWRNPQC